MKSIFLEELYKNTEGYALIEERYNTLDTPIRDLISKDSLKEEITAMMDSINLTKDYYTIIAQNVAFFLLQIMEPKDLRSELITDLPNVRKDLINSLAQKIEMNLIGKPILNIIEKNWQEDDKEGEEVAEEIEMSLVPLPPELAQKQEKVDQTQNIINIRPNNSSINTPEYAPSPTPPAPNWENKISQTAVNDLKTENRISTDRTLPKISVQSGDPYREIPEE